MTTPSWSAVHVPPIFGFLDPPPAWNHTTHVPPLRDAFGRLLPPVNGTKIRDFPFLPRELPPRLEPWEMEWYFRQSCQLTYNDLRARQPPELGALTNKQKNALNNQRHRQGRLPYNSRSWSNRYYGRPTKKLLELVDNLSQRQVDWNTTWTWIPGGGWHQPSNPANSVPVDYFLLSNRWPHVPSQEIVDAQLTLTNLRALAVQHGSGSWKNLPKDLLPREWGMRVSRTRANGPRRAVAPPATQTVSGNDTHQTNLPNPLVQATARTPVPNTGAMSEGSPRGPRIKDEQDEEMITDGCKLEEEGENDAVAKAWFDVDDKAKDDAHIWPRVGEDFDFGYDADDESKRWTEEKKRVAEIRKQYCDGLEYGRSRS